MSQSHREHWIFRTRGGLIVLDRCETGTLKTREVKVTYLRSLTGERRGQKSLSSDSNHFYPLPS